MGNPSVQAGESNQRRSIGDSQTLTTESASSAIYEAAHAGRDPSAVYRELLAVSNGT